MRYAIALNERGEGNITIVGEDGNLRVYEHTNRHFADLLTGVVNGVSIDELDDIAHPVLNLVPLTPYSNLVTNEDGGVELWHRGVLQENALGRTVVRYHQEGRPTQGLTRFLERLESNTSPNSRQHLFAWVQDRDLEIDEDGYFIAYKGVDANLESGWQGSAIVDDVTVDGHIPNRVGSTVSMPRDEVVDDPTNACAAGLHVGTKSYARHFGSVLLVVKVDPGDVVSVPNGEAQKMRTCRYTVVDVHRPEVDYEPENAPLVSEDEFDSTVGPLVPASFLGRIKSRLRFRSA